MDTSDDVLFWFLGGLGPFLTSDLPYLTVYLTLRCVSFLHRYSDRPLAEATMQKIQHEAGHLFCQLTRGEMRAAIDAIRQPLTFIHSYSRLSPRGQRPALSE